MAVKKEATEKPARKPRTPKTAPKSLKIERKSKRKTTAKKTRQKVTKLDRVLHKSRTLVRRSLSLKKALKGLGLKRIPDKVYKKIDSAMTTIETAIVDVVNSLPAVKKNGGQEQQHFEH